MGYAALSLSSTICGICGQVLSTQSVQSADEKGFGCGYAALRIFIDYAGNRKLSSCFLWLPVIKALSHLKSPDDSTVAPRGRAPPRTPAIVASCLCRPRG